MTARIYKPASNAMQSGPGDEHWVLEFEPEQPRRIDPLMGWTGSGDTKGQVKLKFESKDAALAYARKHGIVAIAEEPPVRKLTIRPLGYGGNFASSRRTPWSH